MNTSISGFFECINNKSAEASDMIHAHYHYSVIKICIPCAGLIEIQVLISILDFCILLNVRMFYRRMEFMSTCVLACVFLAFTSSGAVAQLKYTTF